MKKLTLITMKYLHFIMLAVTAVLFFASCEKDELAGTTGGGQAFPGINELDELEEIADGASFAWDKTLTYPSNGYATATDINSSWLDSTRTQHSPYKYDSVQHSIRIYPQGNHELLFVEEMNVFYSSAYRYIGTEEDPVFRLHEEDWQLFDTVYCIKGSKSTPIKWSGDLSQIVFKRNDGRLIFDNSTYIGATPDLDYKYMKWADNYTYTGECPTNETLVFTAKEWGDSVSRTFTLQ